MLALVTDLFGGRGGMAQYNRDFLGALVEVEAVSSILVLPRYAPDPVAPPSGINQARPRPSRLGYSAAALYAGLRHPVDVVFCGHLYMVPLAWLIARLKRAKLIVQTYGIEAWSRPSRLCQAAWMPQMSSCAFVVHAGACPRLEHGRARTPPGVAVHGR